jgi:ABC-type lipoprotein release transport system permease subunit
VAAGVLIGLAGAAALGSLVSSFLYGIEPTDIVTLTIAIIVIALFAGLASFVPAWRASGVNPTEVLRAE